MAGKTGDTHSPYRRQQDLAVFTKYVQDLCAAFRVFVQTLAGGMVQGLWPCRRVLSYGKILLFKSFPFGLPTSQRCFRRASSQRGQGSSVPSVRMHGAEPTHPGPCLPARWLQRRARQDRWSLPHPKGPCCSQGQPAAARPGQGHRQGLPWGRQPCSAHPPMKLQAAGDALDQPVW